MCHSKYKNSRYPTRGFTFIEVLYALSILALICSSVFVIINRCMNSFSESRLKMEAFELARENMERILAQNSVEETLDYGVSEKNPSIKWQTMVEPFSAPAGDKMWIRAVSAAAYQDSNDQPQKVELVAWLSEVPKEVAEQILKDRQLMNESEFGVQDPNDPLMNSMQGLNDFGQDGQNSNPDLFNQLPGGLNP